MKSIKNTMPFKVLVVFCETALVLLARVRGHYAPFSPEESASVE